VIFARDAVFLLVDLYLECVLEMQIIKMRILCSTNPRFGEERVGAGLPLGIPETVSKDSVTQNNKTNRKDQAPEGSINTHVNC